MGKDKWARNSASAALSCWANLVGAIVVTMLELDVGNDAIHRFLDHLSRSNGELLAEDELDFSDAVIGLFRSMVPGND